MEGLCLSKRWFLVFLRKNLRLRVGFHRRRLGRHHPILRRWILRRIRGSLDGFRFLNGRFRTAWIRTRIQRHLAAHRIAPSIRPNGERVRRTSRSVRPRRRKMRFFVRPHMSIRNLKLADFGELLGVELPSLIGMRRLRP